eukprot:116208-Pelagomonas_calceolata.AAC.3
MLQWYTAPVVHSICAQPPPPLRTSMLQWYTAPVVHSICAHPSPHLRTSMLQWYTASAHICLHICAPPCSSGTQHLRTSASASAHLDAPVVHSACRHQAQHVRVDPLPVLDGLRHLVRLQLGLGVQVKYLQIVASCVQRSARHREESRSHTQVDRAT